MAGRGKVKSQYYISGDDVNDIGNVGGRQALHRALATLMDIRVTKLL